MITTRLDTPVYSVEYRAANTWQAYEAYSAEYAARIDRAQNLADAIDSARKLRTQSKCQTRVLNPMGEVIFHAA